MADQQKPGQPAPKTGGKKAPPNETKGQRFIRLANYRVPKAIDAIKAIGHLSGNSYEFTPAQVEKVRQLLNDTVKNTMARFSDTGKTETTASIF